MDRQPHVALHYIHIQADDFLTTDRSAGHEIQLEAIMTDAQVTRRTVAVVAALLLLAAASSSDRAVQAGSRGQGLPGTWFISLPGGLTGFYTYHQDGTMTGTVSTTFGAPPQPPGPTTYGSADHGVWRQVGGGFESVVFRMFFDPATGDPLNVIRVRISFAFGGGRDSTSGTWDGDIWFCPTALTCPDPNSTPPDVEGIAPPPPLNTITQTRVRLP